MNHTQTHSNKKLQCKYCNISLSSKGALDEHVKRHFDTKTYLYSKCDKEFASVLSRKIHMTGKHGPGFVCLDCSTCFDLTSQLAKHRHWCGKGARSDSPEY